MPRSLTLIAACSALVYGVLLLVPGGDRDSVQAGLFAIESQVLCLEADGQESVSGKFGGDMVPGSEVSGKLYLSHCDELPDDLLDLDMDFSGNLTDVPPAAVPDLRHLLIASQLLYGSDDLLLDDDLIEGDRNLTQEIDADPERGNQDGQLSLHELAVGANDLPPPGPPNLPTLFVLSVHFMETAPNEAQGDAVNLTILFQLSDKFHQDLN